MKKIFLLVFILLYVWAYSNDGAYYASGNQLIPIQETDISVKKEILTVKKIEDNSLLVTVYYEFFNPGKEKELLVGFEAFSPYGAVDYGTPKGGAHPYMRNFTVNFNNEILPYHIDIVPDSIVDYYKKGKINFISEKEALSLRGDLDYSPFYYVYNFKAKFKKGYNMVQHSYIFELSGNVYSSYNFNYILTAANRWANKQIDDFTLIVDMGEFQDFYIGPTFFKKESDWIMTGIGVKNMIIPKFINETLGVSEDSPRLHCMIQNGELIFQKKNFHPEGELYLTSMVKYYGESFDAQEDKELSFMIQGERVSIPNRAKNEVSLKILKNLPFARRGYVFNNPELKEYYSSQEWYIPNVNYKPNVERLTKEEKEWLKSLAIKNE